MEHKDYESTLIVVGARLNTKKQGWPWPAISVNETGKQKYMERDGIFKNRKFRAFVMDDAESTAGGRHKHGPDAIAGILIAKSSIDPIVFNDVMLKKISEAKTLFKKVAKEEPILYVLPSTYGLPE